MFAKAVLVALTLLALGQSASAQSPSGLTAVAYTLDTPVEIIAADPARTAVLNKDIPGLLTDPSYGVIKSMTLKSIARLSGGDLTQQMLAQAEADLKALPPKKAPNQN